MPIYKQTTEITKIDDVWANIDRDIVEVYFGDKNIFTVWGEYTGSLPITINANGDAMLDYRIYGASGGVGELTENLIDANKPGVQRVELEPNTDYCFCKYTGSGVARPQCNVYDENDNKLFGDYINIWVSYNFTNPSDGAYAIISFLSDVKGKLSFVKGRAANNNTLYPAKYIPYGYKLPMTVSDGNTAQTVPVHIGENQLDSVEGVADYVDKSSGKIVRMIGEYTFTGDENIQAFGLGFYTPTISNANSTSDLITIRFSHFTARYNTALGSLSSKTFGDNCGCFRANYGNILLRSSTNFTTVDECNAYLKSQYDNGTPVKMWYIMETPIEEDPPVPFPEIPTIDGETVIDYDGEPKPSQMYIKYRKQHS